MYGQQIGKLEQPLENVIVEEIERDSGLREVHFTIAMRNLPSTAPIAEGVADLAQSTVGPLLVEEINMKNGRNIGRNSQPFSYPLTFEEYVEIIRSAKPGDDLYTALPFLKAGYNCVSCNHETLRNGRTPELFYVLNTNSTVEGLCAVGEHKDNHPMSGEMSGHGVMAYRIKGTGDAIEMIANVKRGILEVVAQNTQNKAPLTWNHIAIMTEALLEVDYHTHRTLREGDGPQRYARAVPFVPRGPIGRG